MIKGKIRKSAFASASGTFLDRILQRWRSAKAAKCVSGGEVCDLGCGLDGYFLLYVANKISHGTGFDLKVKKTRNKKIELFNADLNKKLPINNDSFDTLVSLAVIEHIDNYKGYIEEAYRILKPGGNIVLTTPHPFGEIVLRLLSFLKLIDKDEINDHKRYFFPKEIKLLLSDSGFYYIKIKRFQLGLNSLFVATK